MDYSGEFPRLVLDYGIGFITFYIFLVVLFVAATARMIRSLKKASEAEQRRIILMLTGMFFPWLAVMIRSAGFTGGYEVSFLGIIFMAIFAMLALIKYGYFDSVQQAVTNVIYKSSEGLLVLDNDRYVLYFNSVIKELFPEVSDKKSVKCVPALHDIIEKCFDENGKLGETHTPNTVEAGDRIFEIKIEPILEAGFIQGYTVRAFDSTAHYRSI